MVIQKLDTRKSAEAVVAEMEAEAVVLAEAYHPGAGTPTAVRELPDGRFIFVDSYTGAFRYVRELGNTVPTIGMLGGSFYFTYSYLLRAELLALLHLHDPNGCADDSCPCVKAGFEAGFQRAQETVSEWGRP